MIYIYYSATCQSSRKAIAWLESENLEYKKKNIISEKLSSEDIFRMLKNSLNGFDDIISKKSKIYKESNINFDSLKTSELITFIINNPTILKRPIIVDDLKFEVGYNKDDIRVFIPKERRISGITRYCDSCSMDPSSCEEPLTYRMNLQNEPFSSIKSHNKNVEMRLNDEKRKNIKKDDIIIFTNEETKEELTVRVISSNPYPSFEEVYDKYPKERLGYSKDGNASYKDMYKYYTYEQILKNGVLAIEIELMD